MTSQDTIAIGAAVISFLSFVASAISALISRSASREARENAKKANQEAQRANQISIGSLETSLRDAIGRCNAAMRDSGTKIIEFLGGRSRKDLKPGEEKQLRGLERIYNSTVEDLLNAYEDACGKYLDGKIDKARFKETYIKEIQNVCKPKGGFSKRMHSEDTSDYESIWKVYREWYGHEGAKPVSRQRGGSSKKKTRA